MFPSQVDTWHQVSKEIPLRVLFHFVTYGNDWLTDPFIFLFLFLFLFSIV